MKWTEERLQKEANKYENRSEFSKYSNGAYQTAIKKKLLNKLFENHINNGYCTIFKCKWTNEKLQDEANKYKTRTELKKHNGSAYMAAHNKKIIDKLFENHINSGFNLKRKKEGYWTYNKLQEEVNKYKTRWEFGKKDNATYNIALRYGYINKLFKNHSNNGYTDKKHKQNYWTKELLQIEANKYKTRGEFQLKNKIAYSASNSKKLIDKLFEKHKNKGYSINMYIDDVYVIYVYELPKHNKAYVGLTNNIIRRDREHVFSSKEKLNTFCKKMNISYPKYKILENNLNIKDVLEKEQYWINYYKSKKWDMFNKNKASSLGSLSKKWSKNKLKEESDKYITRGEFQKNNPAAYQAAQKIRIIDELFDNHINQGYVTFRKKRNKK